MTTGSWEISYHTTPGDAHSLALARITARLRERHAAPLAARRGARQRATVPSRVPVRSRARSPTPQAKKEKVTIIGSGNWGSAIAKIVGRNVIGNDEFEDEVRMWVFQEQVDGRDLTEIINTDHENVKYLPVRRCPTQDATDNPRRGARSRPRTENPCTDQQLTPPLRLRLVACPRPRLRNSSPSSLP
jgi:hypothetical protein